MSHWPDWEIYLFGFWCWLCGLGTGRSVQRIIDKRRAARSGGKER